MLNVIKKRFNLLKSFFVFNRVNIYDMINLDIRW
jgi:hypothetical protein